MSATIATSESERWTKSRALPVLGAIALCVFLGDVLFWRADPGVSIGVFALTIAGLAVALSSDRAGWRRSRLLGVLLIASCAQTGVETSLSNFVVLFCLIIALAAEANFPTLASEIVRWIEGAIMLLQAPARWLSFGKAVMESPIAISSSTMVAGDNLVRALRVLVPGVALCAVFAVILSSGNVMLGRIFTHLADHISHWLLDFDFSPGRFVLWAGYATLALGLLWPVSARTEGRRWTQPFPRWRRAHRREALWQSSFALLALNGLFFMANTIDAIYLWRNTALPADVNASEYLHAGVWSLIVAVVLSAGVLAAVFQQEMDVSGSRWMKALGLTWVAQNLVLIAGVFLRLKLYVDAWQLTEKRVYVGCFLALVITGLVFLAWSIIRGCGLHWLIRRNLIATFILFMILQFPDVAGAVARFNVSRWQREPSRGLDLDYIVTLGPNAWPVLVNLTKNGRDSVISSQAETRVRSLAAIESKLRRMRDWRAWQTRREAGVNAVLTHASR